MIPNLYSLPVVAYPPAKSRRAGLKMFKPAKIHFSVLFCIKTCIIVCLFVLSSSSAGIHAQNRIYVDHAATGATDGSTWADAFTDLQAALAVAQSGGEVWVAQGTYRPTQTTDRSISFEPKSGVRLFGGFAGTETDPSQRDWDAHPTVLSGDISVQGDSTDNSHNIMAFGEVEEGSLLDGLTFRGGVAEPAFLVDPFQRDGCGGALYIEAGDGVAYPVLRNCRFERNYARLNGGAVFIRAAQDGSIAPQFLNCVFEGNNGGNGAAVYCNGYVDIERVPDFGDCTFTNNKEIVSTQGVIRYHGLATNDTLHFWGCRFEKHVGMGRVIWTSTDNHLRVDRCSFKENTMTLLRIDFLGVNQGLQSCYVTRSESVRNLGLLGVRSVHDTRVSDCVFRQNRGLLSVNCPKTEISDCLLDSNTFVVTAIQTSELCKDCRLSNLTISNSTSASSPGYGYSLFRMNLEHGPVKYHNINVFNNDSLHLFDSNIYGDSVTFTNFNIIGNRLYRHQNSQAVPGRYQNTVFYGNEYITPDYFASFPALTLENCAIDFPNCSSLPSTVTCINNLFNLDPLFRDTANHDYSLLPCSPLINAGSNAAAMSILTDIAGNPRIQGGTVDIGAYEAPTFALAAEPQVQPACLGSSNGSIAITPVFGCEPYTYEWLPDAGNGPQLNGLPPGGYLLTITDGSGRQILDTVQVASAPLPVLNPVVTDVQCGTTLGGSIAANVSNGSAPYHYEWLPAGMPDTSYLSQLSPLTYHVSVTDANGCQDSASANISLLGLLTLMVDGQSISCFGETDGWLSATPLTGASPFSWDWQGWAGTDSIAQPLGPGMYSVTVSDVFGCTAAFTFPPMNQPDSLYATVGTQDQTNLSMPNGAAVVTTISGGMAPYGFDWSTGSTQQAIAGLTAGDYIVTVTDKNGCEVVVEVVVDLMVTATEEIGTQAFIVYPNPAADWLKVAFSQPIRGGKLELSDASGRVLRSTQLAAESVSCTMDLSGLPGGSYVATLRNNAGKEMFVGKVLKH